MSDPNDVWQNSAPPANGDSYNREASPRRDDRDAGRDRSPAPRRDRSRSPGRNGAGGGGGENRGRNDDGTVNPGNNLHVSGLARSITREVLEDMFVKCGKVQKASIMTDPHTQESRGFGFVMMETPEDAVAAIAQINGTSVDGRTITVAHAHRSRARTPTPGRYHGVKLDGPPSRGYGGGYGGGYAVGADRPYMPRSYDSRYSDRGPPPRGYDDRDRRYDDRERRYDDRRDVRDRYYDDYRRYDYRSAPADRDYYDRSAPPADRERGYDRRDDRRDERPRYDEVKESYDRRPRY